MDYRILKNEEKSNDFMKEIKKWGQIKDWKISPTAVISGTL